MKGEHSWMNSIHNDVGDDANNDVDHVICDNIQVKGLVIKHWFKLAPCYLKSLWIWFATFTNDDGKLLYNPKMGALSK